MTSIRSVLFQTLIFSGILSTCICLDRNEERIDHAKFQKLLAQVDPPSLHAALHDFAPRKFSHGMFPEDRTALEAIQKEEPGVATGILKMAKLGKRQDNGTVTTTSVPPDATTTINPSLSPVGPSSPSTVTESLPASSIPASPSSSPGALTTSRSSSAATTTTAPIFSSSVSASSGAVLTTTDSQGHVIVTTVGGGAVTLSGSSSSSSKGSQRSSITSTLLQTSTLPNGEQSTLTSVTVIGGGDQETATATAGGATGTSKSNPGLQTGEAVMTRGCGREMAVVLGAAVGVAFML